MHIKAAIAMLSLLLSLDSTAPLEIRDSSEAEPSVATIHQIKWPRKTIEVDFSESLRSPGANVKPGSDVVGAARRALMRWSAMANLKFVVNWSNEVAVSQASGGDG